MRKSNKNTLKVKGGNSSVGINRKAIQSFKSADEMVAWVKERPHIYQAFGNDPKRITEAWQDEQPKAEPKPQTGGKQPKAEQ